MSNFSWLLLSDFHLKSDYTVWNQNVVLRDMMRDIESRLLDIDNLQFVIVSGDLAHGGKKDQYSLVESFLVDLLRITSLKTSDLYIVPGNHDVDRDNSQLAFHGARAAFLNSENVERFLSNSGERHSLLARLSAYYEFEERVCPHLKSAYTDDNLAYLITRHIDSLPIGIAGLNSAILCGDNEDQGKLVLGDRPIIDLCEKIRAADVRLVVTVVHHPPSWLADFDKRTFDARLLPYCDILHRGHLHEPDVQPVYVTASNNCLAISAGASYAWRQFENSYSIVTVDVSAASCKIVTYTYNSHAGDFRPHREDEHGLRFRGELPGDPSDCAIAIRSLGAEAEQLAPYLAALLYRKIAEMPITLNGTVLFASSEMLSEVDDADYVASAKGMLALRNSLLAFASDVPIDVRILASSEPLLRFSKEVVKLASRADSFKSELNRRVEQAAKLFSVNTSAGSSLVRNALDQFVSEEDWNGLEILAKRYSRLAEPSDRRDSLKYLAHALAHSDDPRKRAESIGVANSLIADSSATVSDFELAFAINRSQGFDSEAERIIVNAIERFGDLPQNFRQGGYGLAVDSGSHLLRVRLDQLNGVSNG